MTKGKKIENIGHKAGNILTYIKLSPVKTVEYDCASFIITLQSIIQVLREMGG